MYTAGGDFERRKFGQRARAQRMAIDKRNEKKGNDVLKSLEPYSSHVPPVFKHHKFTFLLSSSMEFLKDTEKDDYEEYEKIFSRLE
ncbi:hypothetical protein L484_027827 [Morus notabilis]|uniref:IBB domain-containing protein n=1 Tax=Morus notabilis TaxID=981085 RepID=W9RNI8_9ROSA|nr:hypothetical protein L484_027827 [Morus notabilis]